MNKIKHQKLKNAGVLFELLVRQITSDTLLNKESMAINILKKFFKKNTELFKEYSLYQTLIKDKFSEPNKALSFLNAVLESRAKLDSDKLRVQKYNLIKEIKKHYDINNFIKAKIHNYKPLASIYILFESSQYEVEPKILIESRYTVLDFISAKKPKQLSDNIIESVYNKQDKDIRLLALKIAIDKFNDKYKDLDNNQKYVLSEYINSVSNSPKLRDSINDSAKHIKKELSQLYKTITDKVVRIKMKEVIKLTESLSTAKKISDSDITRVLNYYELIKELKSL